MNLYLFWRSVIFSGGTVDITVHEVTSEGEINELHHATGGAWGGTKVDEAFKEFIKELFGDIDAFERDYVEDYFDFFQDFENKKRNIPPSGHVTIRVPSSLTNNLKGTIASSRYSDRIKVVADKMRIDVGLLKELFHQTVNNIVGHVKDILRLPTAEGCSAILMVGGFSECQLLQDKVRESFTSMNVIIPGEAWLAVLKGAVMFGHKPTVIAERVSKYTYGNTASHVKGGEFCYFNGYALYRYNNHPCGKIHIDENGIERCDDIFEIHVKKGQSIKMNQKLEEQIFSPEGDTQTGVTIQIYASPEDHPYFVTDEGCQMIGEFYVPVTGGREGVVGVTFVFGGTEIEVIAEDKLTGEVTRHRVDFLG